MKIIGTSAEGFLIAASADEVSNLIGYRNKWEMENENGDKRGIIRVGLEIDVHSMYHHLYNLSFRQDKLEKQAVELEAIAALLRVKNPVINQLADEAKDAMGEVQK